ncbi:hypothetical protein BGZ60DRAFT_6201 [Tricladium varicosporioides]|nr:hypothetical protein BGZ60DRAFT_6201 [Hymenoscyphus varicosporioides]
MKWSSRLIFTACLSTRFCFCLVFCFFPHQGTASPQIQQPATLTILLIPPILRSCITGYSLQKPCTPTTRWELVINRMPTCIFIPPLNITPAHRIHPKWTNRTRLRKALNCNCLKGVYLSNLHYMPGNRNFFLLPMPIVRLGRRLAF